MDKDSKTAGDKTRDSRERCAGRGVRAGRGIRAGRGEYAEEGGHTAEADFAGRAGRAGGRGSRVPVSSRLEGICTAFTAVLFGVILLFLWWISATSTYSVYGGSEVLERGKDNPLLHLIVLAAVIGGWVLIRSRKEHRCHSAAESQDRKLYRLLFIAAGCYVIWLLLTGYWPGSDQRMTLESGQALLRGDFSPWEPYGFVYGSQPLGYAYTYPSQNGLILYFALLSLFFRGYTAYAAQALNIVFVVFGMYYLCRLFEQEILPKRPRGLLLLMLFFLPFTFYFTFVYGTVPGFALSVWAMYEEYRYLATSRWKHFFCAAFGITAAVLLKSNYLIVLAAMVIYLLSYSVFRKKAAFLLAALLMVFIHAGTGRAMNLFLEAVTSYPVSSGSPMLAWVEMGLQEGSRGPGWYNGYNVGIFSENDLDPEKTTRAVKQDLQHTLEGFAADPHKAADFFIRKCGTIWAEPTFQSLWIMQVKGDSWLLPGLTRSLYEKGGALNTIYVTVCNLFQSLIYGGALLFLIGSSRRLRWGQLMPAIVFIGGFLFHLVWEAKGQYSVCYFVLLIPYAVSGISRAAGFAGRKLKR